MARRKRSHRTRRQKEVEGNAVEMFVVRHVPAKRQHGDDRRRVVHPHDHPELERVRTFKYFALVGFKGQARVFQHGTCTTTVPI